MRPTSDVDSYMRDRGDETVGGLIPVVKVTASEIMFLGFNVRARAGTPDEVEIGLVATETGWTQVNRTTGRVRQLVPPWQLPERLGPNDPEDRFDDLLDAMN